MPNAVSAGRTVLISGASIAGPASAYWLNRYGFEVTVVERSASFRQGGYPIDLRGTAMDAGRRMGLYDELIEANIHTKLLNFVDESGKVVASIKPETITGGVEGRDVEIPRGSLGNLLYGHTKDDTEYLFNDSIETLVDHGDRVDVTFRNGTPPRSFDFVIGADGLHSNVRRLVFGDESQFEHYLGRYFVGFMCENTLGMSREGMSLQLPDGRNVTQYAVGDNPPLVHAFFSFNCPEPPALEDRTLERERALFKKTFADVGWEAPRMVKALMEYDEAFYDTVSQIHMPAWSKGRVALVGDAGYAASFLSGQGSSLAMVGAYVLAGELAGNPDHRATLESYEQVMRPFVRANQAIAHVGRKKITGSSKRQLAYRNFMLGYVFPVLGWLRLGPFMARKNRATTTAISLKDYSSLTAVG